MKNLLKTVLLIFTVSLFISCGDDDKDGDWTSGFDNWNSPESPNYIPNIYYNPIEGTWVKENSMDPDTKLYTHIFIFTKEFKYQEQHYNSTEKQWGSVLILADYIINDKEFKLNTKYTGVDSRRVFRYRIENDQYEGRILYINFAGENSYNRYFEYTKEQ